MKIGIATFQWSDNYGAVLQAYALQSFLREQGHAVQIIDYRVTPPVPWYRKWLAKTPRGCILKWEAAYKAHRFAQFRRKHLVLTPASFRSAGSLAAIADRFDVLITGSDQVWNPRWLSQAEGLFDLYLLSFAGPQVRRVSYAASFGHAEKATMNENDQQRLGAQLKQLDAISVREPSGISLVRELSGRTDAVQVVDPTLLLGRAHYEGLAGLRRNRAPYLFAYMLHGLQQDAACVIRQMSGLLHYQVVQCNLQKTALHREYTLPSPTGWLRQIRDAAFMVTNSFHGVVFCLVFHIPFVALLISGQTGSMNARIQELLDTAGLAHRIVHPGEVLAENSAAESIDWKRIDIVIAELGKKSMDYLASQGL